MLIISVYPLKDIIYIVSMEDFELIELITKRHDSEKGYRLLITTYKERLYWHIRRMVKTHEDADDILQNTFIKVFKNIENFKGNSSLQTWLYKIATNESISFLNNPKTQSFDSLDNLQIETYANEMPDYEGLGEKLEKAIDSLPDKQRIVFNLRYYDEMPYRDIAEITETSVSALKSSFHHAVKKIEAIIKS